MTASFVFLVGSLSLSFAQFVPNPAPIFPPAVAAPGVIAEPGFIAPVVGPIQPQFSLPIGPLLVPGLPPFTSAFLQNVAQSEILNQVMSKLFTTPIKGQVLYNPLLNSILNLPMQGTDAVNVAQSMANGFKGAANVINPSLYVLSLGYAIDRFLTDQGYITDVNSEVLSRQYADFLENSALTLQPTATQEQVFSSIIDGTVRFLNELNVQPTAAPLLTDYFSQALNALPKWVS